MPIPPVYQWAHTPDPTNPALPAPHLFCLPIAVSCHLATDRAPWLDGGLDEWSPTTAFSLPQARAASAGALGLLSPIPLLPCSTFFLIYLFCYGEGTVK